MNCASCGEQATEIYPLTGAPMCPRHAGALRRSVITLIEDAETIVKHLSASYLPEMRGHDLAMLRRIVDQEIPDEERVEVRLHMTARKIAAHTALEERLAYAVA